MTWKTNFALVISTYYISHYVVIHFPFQYLKYLSCKRIFFTRYIFSKVYCLSCIPPFWKLVINSSLELFFIKNYIVTIVRMSFVIGLYNLWAFNYSLTPRKVHLLSSSFLLLLWFRIWAHATIGSFFSLHCFLWRWLKWLQKLDCRRRVFGCLKWIREYKLSERWWQLTRKEYRFS